MTPVIEFVEDELDDHTKAGISGALRRIIWQHPVAAITVTRHLSGGVGGARVIEVRLRHENSFSVRVVKIADTDQTNREWSAYNRWIAPHANIACAPVRERTPDRLPDDPARGWTALVYDHAAQFAGAPSEAVRTLADVAEKGLDNLASAVAEILDRTGDVLHRRWQVIDEKSNLSSFNNDLGPGLTIEVERLDGDGFSHGHVTSTDHILLHDDEVLRRTARGAEGDIAVGTRVAMVDLTLTWGNGRLFAEGHDIMVELRPAPGIAFDAQVLTDGRTAAVRGRVTATRGLTHRETVVRAIGTPVHPYADPFTILPDVLCDALPGRVMSVCHGDLNLRNVIAVRDSYFLIDYERTRQSAQQTDFCWLEIGVLRDVLADREFGDLLSLERCTALATALLESGKDADAVARVVTLLVSPGTSDAVRALLAIRTRALARYPRHGGPRYLDEYLRHLFLSAHRTFKWPDEWQSPAKIRASVAAAAVATEWLDGRNPFRHWAPQTLSATLATLASVIDLRHDHLVRLVTALVRALEAAGPLDDDAEAAVAVLAGRLVACRCGRAARALLAEYRLDRSEMVTLPATERVLTTLANARDITLAGPPGSGKSTVVRELARRLAEEVVDSRAPRMPLLVDGVDSVMSLPQLLADQGLREVATEACVLGAVHMIVDAGPVSATAALRALVSQMRNEFPRTRLVVCERTPDVTAAAVEELQPLRYREVVTWLCIAVGNRADGEHLLRLALHDPRWSWVDLRRPRWLALVTRFVRIHGLPDRLPAPHEIVASLSTSGDRVCDAQVQESLLHARELARWDIDDVAAAARRATDWTAFHILVTLPDTGANLVHALGRAVEPTRPVLTAELFRAAGLHEPGFAARMLGILRANDAGPVRWRAAAHALSIVDAEDGLAGLTRTIADPAVPLGAARAVFDNVERLYVNALGRYGRRRIAQRLLLLCRQVLDNPDLADRREAALTLLARVDLPGLELYMGQLVDRTQPWPVVRRAVTALRVRGVALPPALADQYSAACRTRLAELDTLVPEMMTADRKTPALAEKARLVKDLAPDAPLRWLLGRRFAYDTSTRVVQLVNHHLASAVPTAELVRDWMGDDDVRALAAAHRMLRDAPATAGRVLTDLPDDVTAMRLQVAAAALPHAGHARVDRVADRFTDLLRGVDADRLAGMAGLIVALHRRDRALGLRLAWSATRIMVERGLHARHGWPWSDSIAHVYGTTGDLNALLCRDDETALAALSVLASRDFHRSARPGPQYRLTDQARRRLMDLPKTVDWALAAGAAGVVEALPDLPPLTEAPDTVVTRGSARYGLLDQAEAADVLAVMGYLARKAYDQLGMTREVVATYRFLSEFTVADRHPSVATGRLIALAYLGDCASILNADLSDSRMGDAARYAVGRWLPGPATSPGCESPLLVARWITTHLSEKSVPTEQRWVLDELAQHAERVAGIPMF